MGVGVVLLMHLDMMRNLNDADSLTSFAVATSRILTSSAWCWNHQLWSSTNPQSHYQSLIGWHVISGFSWFCEVSWDYPWSFWLMCTCQGSLHACHQSIVPFHQVLGSFLARGIPTWTIQNSLLSVSCTLLLLFWPSPYARPRTVTHQFDHIHHWLRTSSRSLFSL